MSTKFNLWFPMNPSGKWRRAGVFPVALAGLAAVVLSFAAYAAERTDVEHGHQTTTPAPRTPAASQSPVAPPAGSQSVGQTTGGLTFSERRAMADKFNEAIRNGQYVYVGVNGEFIAPVEGPDHSLGFVPDCSAIYLITGNEMDLYLTFPTPFAHVSSDGTIKLNEDVIRGLRAGKRFEPNPRGNGKKSPDDAATLKAAAPGKWPREKGQQTHFAKLAPNTVLAKKLKKAKSAHKRPDNATGWLYLTIGDIVIVPSPDTPMPDNFLWVVPEADGGFKLVHSGPLHSGTYATIKANGDVYYGNAPTATGEDRPRDSVWTSFSQDKISCIPPAGFAEYIHPCHDSAGYRRYFSNGKEAGITTPPEW